MPKRGGGQGGYKDSWKQNNYKKFNNEYSEDYSEYHDDRVERKFENRKDRRKVSFKPSGAGPNRPNNFVKGRTADLAIRTRVLEDDDEMTEMTQNRGHSNFRGGNGGGKNVRFRRRGSPIPRGGHGPPGKKRLIGGTSGWFQVTIPYGQKYPKELILKTLLSIVEPSPFLPHYYKIETSQSTFYVDDIKIAEALLNADRTMSMPDGFKMIIKVRNNIPQVQIDDNLKQKMKMAMVKRYSAATKALDLTKFHSDVDLTDIFCALFRPTIMLAAIDIISENIPDLEALNLDDNKIHLLDHLKCLATKLPFLKILHMAKNKITSTSALDALKECQLVELKLDGNPLKDRMREDTVYVSEVRKKFPKLLKLDDVILPPQIGFDVNDECSLPPPKASFLCNYSGGDIVRQFLEQYFILFDSENRQPLLDAYHEHAMFSLTATYSSSQNQRLSSYLPHNRNALRVRDLETRCKHLKTGRLPVVSFLSLLPATQHDPQSFAVDLTFFSAQLILLTVTGIFKEKSKPGHENLRSFQRSLVIVPSGSGFCIKNEVLHINNATIAQIKTAFKPLAQATAIPPPVVHQATTVTNATDDATKLQMIQTMSQQSHMNVEWSKKCLEETNWDFNRAATVFTELHSQNKIPPEAFVK